MASRAEPNPFASPQAEAEQLRLRKGRPRYRALRWPTCLLLMLLGMCLLLDLTAAAIFWRQNARLETTSVAAQEVGQPRPTRASKQVAGLQKLLFCATAIVFLWWLRRAYRNLDALHRLGLRFGPWSAVAVWFIPIWNLFRPFQAMKELWRESDPAQAPGGEGLRRQSARVLSWWWVLYLIMLLGGRLAEGVLDDARDIVSLQRANLFAIGVEILSASTALLAMLVVVWISRNQDRHHRTLTSAEHSQPLLATLPSDSSA